MKERRTRRFYNNLPSDRLDNLESFLNLFMLWYNHLRRDWEESLWESAYRNGITGPVGSKVITRAVLGDWRASRRWLFREKERRYNKKGAS